MSIGTSVAHAHHAKSTYASHQGQIFSEKLRDRRLFPKFVKLLAFFESKEQGDANPH
jgi:hypothetical protein